MTETARIYGGSLYDLAAEENLTGEILGQMEQIRTLLRENPEYERLLSEPSIPQMERNGMDDRGGIWRSGATIFGEFYETDV